MSVALATLTKMNRESLAWATGLFDGEGCFHFTSSRRRRRDSEGRQKIEHSIQTRITQKDREVLDRFQTAVGLGRVYGPYKSTDGKPRIPWQFAAYGLEQTQAIIVMLWPWLGRLKRQQALTVLAQAAAHPPKPLGRPRRMQPVDLF